MVTIREETATLALTLLRCLEHPTAKAAAQVRTNGEASVTHFQAVEDAIKDLNRGLYG